MDGARRGLLGEQLISIGETFMKNRCRKYSNSGVDILRLRERIHPTLYRC